MVDTDDIQEITEEEEPIPGDAEAEMPPEAKETKEPVKAEKPVAELKVIIIMRNDRYMLGVQSPDCDPVYTTMTGDLNAVLQMVPGFITEAKLKWAERPRYPKADLPQPSPSPAPVRQPAATAPAKAKNQPSFF